MTCLYITNYTCVKATSLRKSLRTYLEHSRVHTSGEAAIQTVRDRIQQATESAAELRSQAATAEEEMQELQQERDNQSGGPREGDFISG